MLDLRRVAALHKSVCLFDPKACRLGGPPLCPAAEQNSTAAIRVPDWAAEALEVRIGNLDSPLSAGLTWVDANTDAELAQIVWPRGEAPQEPVVWTASGGLARAAAGSAKVTAPAQIDGQVLGLIGSAQPATDRQVVASSTDWLPIVCVAGAPRIASRL